MKDTKGEQVISIITSEQQQGTEGFLPGFGGRVKLRKSSLDAESIRDQLENIANQMSGVGDSLTDRIDGFSVEEISLSLTIDAKGEISLLGLTSGSVGAASTIQLVLRRSKEGSVPVVSKQE